VPGRQACPDYRGAVTRIVLVRHGESVATVERRLGGPLTCSGLSPLGRKQAEALADRLARTGELVPDVLVSSTMPRARETAEILAPALGELPIVVDEELEEHNPGPDADGMTFADYVERYGHQDWKGDPYTTGFENGESIARFQFRAAQALHRLAAAHDGECVVVVCHGGVIDVGLRSFLNVALTGGFELHTANTSLTELVKSDRVWRLVRYNDAAHLEGLPPETVRV
jgi:2,3-bisphosphoglycerate-dependent phosphoglycerate mutase